MVSRRIVLGVLALAFAAVGLLADASPRAQPVEAAFPGTNGKIAFVSNRYGSTSTFSNSDIFTMHADGSGVARVVPDYPARDWITLEGYPTWSPDGTRIAFTSDHATGGSAYVMDGDGRNTFGAGQTYSRDPAWAPDGRHLVVSADYFSSEYPLGSRDLFVVDLEERRGENLTNSEIREEQPAWSPDGEAIAFVVPSSGNTSSNVFTVGADGEVVTNLTDTDESYNAEPDWSPDGTKIAFSSSRDGNSEIHVMEADGSNPVNVTNDTGEDFSPAWSPDGGRIAFTTNRDGNYEIYTINVDGTDPINVTNSPASDSRPSWQPIVKGNANCDDAVDAIDAAIVLQYGAGLIGALPCEDDADVNGDGDIDSVDAALILQYTAGLLDSLPAQRALQ